jgi:hypothetical protein
MVQRTPDVRVFILQPFQDLFYRHFRFLQSVLRRLGLQVRSRLSVVVKRRVNIAQREVCGQQ